MKDDGISDFYTPPPNIFRTLGAHVDPQIRNADWTFEVFRCQEVSILHSHHARQNSFVCAEVHLGAEKDPFINYAVELKIDKPFRIDIFDQQSPLRRNGRKP